MSALPARRPGRQLGLRTKPILKLSIGAKATAANGNEYPTKIDHFRVVPGEGVAAAAGRKFTERYGENAKSIDIMLPPRLTDALTINYRAFAGGGSDEGGVLRAIGRTNFATEDYAGGPDVLTVFHQDARVEEVEITGLDDLAAVELGVDLYTTFRFMIPDVLGWGSYAEIVTKGAESTDNLWESCHHIYELFGSKATIAVRPKLVVRPSKARPAVTDRKTGETRRITSRIYVLALVVPETFDDMVARISESASLLPGGSPAAALYGAPPDDDGPLALPVRTGPTGRPPTLGAAAYGPGDYEIIDHEPAAPATPPGAQQPAAPPPDPGAATADAPGSAPATGAVAEAAGPSEPEPDWEPPATQPGPGSDAIDTAGMTIIPSGRHQGKPISEAPATYLKWILDRWADDEFRADVELFVQHRRPETWALWATERDLNGDAS